MRFSTIFLSTVLFFNLLSLSLSANEFNECDECDDYCYGRFAVQIAMATGGNLGIGIVHYTPNTELGAVISGQINNAHHSTKTVTPVIFGGLRHAICDGTYFAYGVNLASTFGTNNGKKIKCDLSGGPYISLEQMITHHVMVLVWINPYQYHYQKIGNHSLSTQSFFNAGGVGLNYVF